MILSEGRPSPGFDLPAPLGAVAVVARQDDADRPVPHLPRQGGEEEVDLLVPGARRAELERQVFNQQIRIRRTDIDVVCPRLSGRIYQRAPGVLRKPSGKSVMLGSVKRPSLGEGDEEP